MSELDGFTSGRGIVADRWTVAEGVTPAGYRWTVTSDGSGDRCGLQVLMNGGHFMYAQTVSSALRRIALHV